MALCLHTKQKINLCCIWQITYTNTRLIKVALMCLGCRVSTADRLCGGLLSFKQFYWLLQLTMDCIIFTNKSLGVNHFFFKGSIFNAGHLLPASIFISRAWHENFVIWQGGVWWIKIVSGRWYFLREIFVNYYYNLDTKILFKRILSLLSSFAFLEIGFLTEATLK